MALLRFVLGIDRSRHTGGARVRRAGPLACTSGVAEAPWTA